MEDDMRSSRIRTLGVVALLAGLALWAGCGGDSSTPNAPTTPTPPTSSTPADVTVTIVAMNGAQSFSPNPVTVRVGQTVAWRNNSNDAMTHTATADQGGFNTGLVSSGATSAPIAMSTAGTFGYHCTPHPTMRGTVVVQ